MILCRISSSHTRSDPHYVFVKNLKDFENRKDGYLEFDLKWHSDPNEFHLNNNFSHVAILDHKNFHYDLDAMDVKDGQFFTIDHPLTVKYELRDSDDLY